jgi:hypothetical protein
MATSTGPKISSVRPAYWPGETLVISVGLRKQPCAGRSVGLVDMAPFGSTPFFTRSRMRCSTCTGATSAPMSMALSSGSPTRSLAMRALELVDEARLDRFLHEEARAGAADLALIEPDGIDEAFDGAVQIGVVEDDVGRLAAEFERQALAGAGGGGADDLADFGRAGEGDLVDAGVVDDGGAGVALPVTMLTTPGGSPPSRRSRQRAAR